MNIFKYFTLNYETIISDFTKAIKNLEKLAVREEKKAELFLAEHLSIKALEQDARDVADKARRAAEKISKLFD